MWLSEVLQRVGVPGQIVTRGAKRRLADVQCRFGRDLGEYHIEGTHNEPTFSGGAGTGRAFEPLGPQHPPGPLQRLVMPRLIATPRSAWQPAAPGCRGIEAARLAEI